MNVAKLLNRTKKLIMMPFFPMYSFSFPYKIFRKIVSMNAKKNYEIVISVFSPFDSAVASYLFKKYNPKVKWCLYTVDTFINQRYNFLNKKGNTTNFWIPKFLNKCDLFIYMRSREKEYANSYFNKWRNKMKSSDIPLMATTPFVMRSSLSNDIEKWVYAGSIGSPHYLTNDLIDIFMGLTDKRKCKLYFYSSGYPLERLKGTRDISRSKVICNSYVPHDELIKVYQSADILVSVKYSNQISVKIFEYMSDGKKIIHISGTPDDPDAEYIRHYVKCIVLTPYKDSIETCVKQLSDWLTLWTKEKENIPINYSYFEMNKLEYTANLILELKRNNL